MRMRGTGRGGSLRRAPLAAAILALGGPWAVAQEAPERPQATGPIEEVVVVGRQYDAAAQLTDERITDDVVSDFLGAEAISRVGDPNVAIALQRVPGLTLVNGQFIYVRGLGERYSSTTLNGARVPSVDLTRSVIPLDLFPAFVVDSLQVQKTYSADRPAAFGAGQIDIRTKGMPNGFVAGLQGGSAWNTANDDDVLTYAGGGDDLFGADDGTRALSGELVGRLNEFQGDVTPQSLARDLRARGNPDATLQDAQQLNREIALQLNRQVQIKDQDTAPDGEFRGYLGNSFFVNDAVEAGFLLSGAYENDWRETTRLERNFQFPERFTDERREATYSVNITGTAALGLKVFDEHELTFKSIFLRNTDDETARSIRFDRNQRRDRPEDGGFIDVRTEYEEREVVINQLLGEHRLGSETRAYLEDFAGGILPDGLLRLVPDDLAFKWFYSDSEAQTDIPNRFTARFLGQKGENLEIVNPALNGGLQSTNYRFTNLDDEVLHHGWELAAPFYLDGLQLEFSGGYQHHRQARDFRQTLFNFGPTTSDAAFLRQPLNEILSDQAVLNPENGFAIQRAGANNQSYIAATMTDSWYGRIDTTLANTWRLVAGARWEQYRQIALDVNPYGFDPSNPVVTTDQNVFAGLDEERLAGLSEEEIQQLLADSALLSNSFSRDDLFPEVSLTYMSSWLTETFQLRAGYSETAVRPDLREITDASYVDPLTDELVFGRPGVEPSILTNYDLRAEWFSAAGDTYTISLFYKEIEDPIEFFQRPGNEGRTTREIINADSGEVYGVELELLQDLGRFAGFLTPFFFQGNLTLQESELVAGDRADSPTSPERDLVNASPWIVNAIVGYDSGNGRHSATIAYNSYGERLFSAGRLGAPDRFEQTRHLLNLNYFWYPTDRMTVQARVRNVLDSPLSLEEAGVEVYEEEFGRTFSLSVQWEY